MVNICISIPEKDLRIINAYCKEKGITRSGLIRRSVKREMSSDINEILQNKNIWNRLGEIFNG